MRLFKPAPGSVYVGVQFIPKVGEPFAVSAQIPEVPQPGHSIHDVKIGDGPADKRTFYVTAVQKCCNPNCQYQYHVWASEDKIQLKN